VVLMTAGVGLFGIFSGFIASWFLSPGAEAEATQDVNAEIGRLRTELAAVRALIERDRSG